jgi:predicted AAA+ superfamily ATPase
MTEIWYRQLGFHNNPLSIKPGAFQDGLNGYKEMIDEISYNILSNKNVFIQGEYGEGKTTILKKLINDFGGKKQVIYFSCNRIEKRINVKRLLNGRYGFWGKMFDLRPRNMILLLDEAQALEKKDYEKLLNYHNSGFFRAIVFVSQSYEADKVPPNMAKTIKVVKLKGISEEDALKIIRKRVGSLPLMPDAIIKTIFAKSNKNVR